MSLFSVAQHRFHLLSDGDQIETNSFLLACSEIVPFFGKWNITITLVIIYIYIYIYFFFSPDKLGSTAFSPVKSDINGNIQASSVIVKLITIDVINLIIEITN